MKNIKLLLLQFVFNFAIAKGVCASCDENDWDVPTYLDGCDDTLAQSGIAGWFAIRCDKSFTDITDEAEWDAKIAAGEVFGRLDSDFIRGSFPVPERDEVTVGACGRPVTVAKNYTATVIDSAYDAGLTHFDLYDYVDKKSRIWNWGIIYCDGSTYGPFNNVTVKADEDASGETTSENKSFQLIFEWKGALGVPKPTLLPFLVGKKLHP